MFHYFNPVPNNPCFLRPFDGSLLKTFWEKEEMLVTSMFFFSPSFLLQWKQISIF